MFGDEGGGDEFRHIVFGFFGEVGGLGELPEVCGGMALHEAAHAGFAGVIAGPCEIPISEFSIELRQIAGSGFSGLKRVPPLIHPEVLFKAIIGSC